MQALLVAHGPGGPLLSGPQLSEGEAADPLGSLTTGRIELLGRIPRASNATYLAQVWQGRREVLVVYKPRRGERPLWDFPTGTLCDREVAAFLVSEELGWRIVPATTARSGPLGEGMVQRFIGHDPQEHYLTLRHRFSERFLQFAAFDVVINNADRKAGHCLLDAHGHIWGVDHGVSFHVEPKLRTVIWEYVGEPLTPAIRRDLAGLRVALNAGLGGRLAGLLSKEEAVALRLRVEMLLEEGRLPGPGDDYPYPWPFV